MEIPNLAQPVLPSPKPNPRFIVIICLIGLGLGFGLSRLFPGSSGLSKGLGDSTTGDKLLSSETISDKAQIKVGQVFGDSNKIFKDSASGKIEAGNINGEGTHILVRPGGLDQRASLISSVIDLDLFVGRLVDIKGETNTSNKTGWLLDVGWLKVLE